jgi:hypothetical protein
LDLSGADDPDTIKKYITYAKKRMKPTEIICLVLSNKQLKELVKD